MGSNPLPVVVISSLGERGSRIALEALQEGAVEVLPKPDGPYSVSTMRGELIAKVRAAALTKGRLARRARPAVVRPAAPTGIAAEAAAQTILAIGASTGGPDAIFQVLSHLPAQVPGIVITQHIPAGFSRAFAERMNAQTAFEVKEAQSGELILPGRVFIAPGDYHLLVERVAGRFRTLVRQGPPVAYQRPSVDVLFHSVAEAAGSQAVAVLLTGMGNDGAKGMKQLREKGAFTIAQDEASCAIFGMPREAIKLGGVDQVAGLEEIPMAITAAVELKLRGRAA
jgi:two-component system chemotaxis response regulator CheB